MSTVPPVTLLPELEQLLSERTPEVADAIRRVVTDIRPCVVLQTTRTMGVPLRGRFVDRLLGRPRPQPRLPRTASKFGGIPYFEDPSELSKCCCDSRECVVVRTSRGSRAASAWNGCRLSCVV